MGAPAVIVTTREELEQLIDRVIARALRRDAEPSLPVPARKRVLAIGQRREVVYFVQTAAGPIKIGTTGYLQGRLDALRSGSFEPLTLLASMPGGRELESGLHGRFVHAHLRGEWFRPTPELLALIARLTEGGSP